MDGRDALGVTAVLRRRRVYDRLIIVGDTSSGVIERKAKSSEVVNRGDVLGGDTSKIARRYGRVLAVGNTSRRRNKI